MVRKITTLVCLMLCAILPQAIKAQLTANFNSNIVIGCSPILVQFSDQSTGSPTIWQWNLGNGITSTLQNPATTYINPGTYTVTLTVGNGSGTNTKTVTNYITVAPTPSVFFTASDSGIVCRTPKTIQFIDNSVLGSAGTGTYLWDFGDGNTSTQQNPTHTYTNYGSYGVTLSVTNSAGCSKTITKANYIQIVQKPTANFSSTNNNSCTLPLTVNFTNTSSGAVSYLWDFGNGATSTAINPTYAYTSTGSFIVRLIATNSAGCKDTLTIPSFVNVGSLTASFTKSTSTSCTNNTVSFTNTSTPGAGNSTWYFGDGTSFTGTNASKSYATPGIYTVKLKVNYNNCSDSTTQTVTVNQGPNTQFTASQAMDCAVPFTTQFTNNTTGASGFLWIFGDGTTSSATNPSHTYTTNGVYTVKLVSYGTNGCNDTLTKTNYINLVAPVMTLGANTPTQTGCAPATITFTTYLTYNYPVTSYSWNFGDGTIIPGGSSMTHTYTTPGSYTITVNFSTGPGCNYTSTGYSLNIGQVPSAAFSFSPSAPCPNQTISFTNSSASPSGTTYTWLFGDGGSSSQTNPARAYTTPGTYNVSLIANNFNCKDTFTLPITVSPPQAQFSPIYSCTNRKQVSFNNTSIGGTTYLWNFGNGDTSTAQNPTYNYTNFGIYSVVLTVTNQPSGCTSTHTQTVNVFDLVAQFSANTTTVCKGTAILFSAQSSSNYNQYNWNFGNGVTQTVTGNNYLYNYPNTGNYNVSLVVRDIRNCYDTIVKTNYIQINANPSTNFSGTPLSGCAPLTVNFTDASTTAGLGIGNRIWTFGDGTSDNNNLSNVAHAYPAGTFNVKLKVIDINGCADSLTKTNYVISSKPVASFYSNDTIRCPGQAVNFVNNSTGTGLTYDWNFGDGGTSTQANPTHSYATQGNYSVTLIVSNGSTCKDTLVRTAYIKVSNVNLSFTASDTLATCPPLAVNLANTSATSSSNFTWTFGNGNASTVSNPTTIYTYPGVYTIKLKGQGPSGCWDSVSKTITVLGPTGTLSYTPTNGCSPLTVQFSSVTNNAQQLIWDMSNGFTQSTTGSSVAYTYTEAGSYLPKLLLSDGNSCIVPIFGVDTIRVDSLSADFSFSPGNICSEGAIQFSESILFAVNQVTNRRWDFGDGGTSTAQNPSHFYNAPGNYTVKLIIGSNQGCNDTIIKTVTILQPPSVNIGNDTAVCDGYSTPIQLQATGAVSYLWSPSSTLSCNNCSNPLAFPASTTTYSVIGTAANGCLDTAQITITVNPLPAISAGNNPTICDGSSVQLQATGGLSYTWTPNTGLSCSSCPNPTANPNTTTTYTVTGTDGNGCINTAQVNVNVNPLPVINVNPSQAICIGTALQLQATGAVNYSWSPSSALSCNNCANPIATPTTTTSYTVTGVDAIGCADSNSLTIIVNPLPIINAGGNHSICLGDSIQLQGTGGINYSWSPSANISCTNCANPYVNPVATTTYSVTGTDINGCSDTSSATITVNPLPIISAGNDVTICVGSSVQLQGTGGVNYTWSPATDLSCSNCSNPIASPVATTIFNLLGIDGNGCSNTGQITVNVSNNPNVTAIAQTNTICLGDTTQLTASGAATYSWTPAAGLSCTNCPNPIANPTTTTTYIVTGMAGNNCSDTGIVTIVVNPLPVVNASTNQTICNGTTLQLQATGATNYSWTPTTSLSCSNCSDPFANPTTTTIYSLTGTDLNGCSGTSSVTLTVNPLPVISAGSNQTICVGNSAQLQASGGISYSWSPANDLSCTNCANPSANPTTTTTYTVTGTDASGCSDTSSITVFVNPLPAISASASTYVFCAGDSTQLQASGAAAYSWTPSTGLSCNNCPNPVATPTASTTYVVTGIAGSNCSDTARVTITVNQLPNVSAGNNVSICYGFDTLLLATGAFNYNWSPANDLSCSGCANPVASPLTTTTYTITGTDTNGCVNTSQLTVIVNASPEISASNDQTTCLGTAVPLLVTGASFYTWTPASGLSCSNCPTPIANPAATTTYTVIGTDGNGCMDTTTATVNVNPLPVVEVSEDKWICRLNTVQIQASGAISYSWTPTSGISCSSCDTLIASPLTTTTYTVTGTDSNGCSNNAKVTVNVHAQPVISAGPDQTICFGETIQLNATGGISYLWTPSDSLSCSDCANPLARPLVDIKYSFVGTDANGCVDSGKINISVIQKQQVKYGNDTALCHKESAQLFASGGDQYLWLPSEGLNNDAINNPIAAPDVTTNYTVIVKQGHCFADTGNVLVTVHPLPSVNAGPDQHILNGTPVYFSLETTNASQFVWTPADDLNCDDCANPIATPKRTTTYTVHVSSDFGCTAQDDVTIFVSCETSLIFMANTFTPNADGNNDRFYPQGKGIETVQRFRILNRWGQTVFDAQNIPVNNEYYGWDGSLNGVPLKPDVFIYQIDAICENGEPIQIIGDISLIK